MMRIIRWFLVLSIVFSSVPSSVAMAAESIDVPIASTADVNELTSAELPSSKQVLDDHESALEAETPQPHSVAGAPSVVALGQVQTIPSSTVLPSPPVLYPETAPDIIATTFSSTNYLDHIEFYNQSSEAVDMSTVKIVIGDARLESSKMPHTCSLRFSAGWLLPKRYVTASDSKSSVISSQRLVGDCVFAPGASVVSIQVFIRGVRVQLIDGISLTASQTYARHIHAQDKSGQRSVNASLKQKGSFISDYKAFSGDLTLLDEVLYEPPSDGHGLLIDEVLPVAHSCLPSDHELDCGDYIKLRNTSDVEIDIAKYRVRAGTLASALVLTWHEPTLTPERDELMLGPGEYFLLRHENDGDKLNLTNGASTVWLEDYFGTKIYQEVAYKDMDKAAADGRSWARDDRTGEWRFGIPSPASSNTFPVEAEPGRGAGGEVALKPCRDDQYRSEETGRCRAIATASVLTPCRDGQYRNEETNRCRSITATVANVLKPCSDDQFRNPETGRCKKIASSDELALADCGEGRERNPETNRCRNIKTIMSVPEAAFAVESVKDTAQAFVGWWALGGVTLLALGYGTWEWRRELAGLISRAVTFFRSGK